MSAIVVDTPVWPGTPLFHCASLGLAFAHCCPPGGVPSIIGAPFLAAPLRQAAALANRLRECVGGIDMPAAICRFILLLSTCFGNMSIEATRPRPPRPPDPSSPMTFQPAKPYNELPALPPKAELETRRVLKLCVEARAAMAELKQAAALIPNPAILINTIPLLEARSSSEIENIVTTTDRLFRFAGDDHAADPATKEALRYRTALREGYESLRRRPLSTNTAVEVCRRIKAMDVDVRKVPGTQLVNHATGKVIYTPPDGERRVRDLLANWERYLHEPSETDPLVRMAVMHYQFEAIHPFSDGNGRTGRVLNLLYLVETGLLALPVLYLSRAIIARKSDYYQGLIDVTAKGRWEAWILFVLAAVHETALWTTSRIHAVRELSRITAEFVRKRDPKLYSHELIEAIFVQPYCRIGHIVDAGIAKRETASAHLKRLAALGILRETKSGRDKIFVFPQLMSVLGGETGEPVPAISAPARVARPKPRRRS